MSMSARVSGTWKEILNNLTVRVGGSFRNVNYGYVRVGGTWRTFYTNDTVGPASPTNVRASWKNNGECHLTWTNPADGDYASMHIEWTVEGVPSFAPHSADVAAPGASMVISSTDTGRIYTFNLTPVDTFGNLGSTTTVGSMEWTGKARGRVPSPIVFDPIDSDTWIVGPDTWSSGDRPWQGSNSTQEDIGIYWYGTNPYGTLRGADITGMALDVFRTSANGRPGAVAPEVLWCTSESRAVPPPSATSGNRTVGTGVCRDGTCSAFTQVTLPSTWWDNFFDPAQATRAYSIIFDSTDTTLVGGYGNVSASYMQMRAWNDTNGGTRHPGRITVTHGG